MAPVRPEELAMGPAQTLQPPGWSVAEGICLTVTATSRET